MQASLSGGNLDNSQKCKYITVTKSFMSSHGNVQHTKNDVQKATVLLVQLSGPLSVRKSPSSWIVFGDSACNRRKPIKQHSSFHLFQKKCHCCGQICKNINVSKMLVFYMCMLVINNLISQTRASAYISSLALIRILMISRQVHYKSVFSLTGILDVVRTKTPFVWIAASVFVITWRCSSRSSITICKP